MESTFDKQLILCECNSTDHQLILVKFLEDEDDLVYVNVHLTTNRNFFQRLWYGLKYAFGYRSRYGDWDEFIFDRAKMTELTDFMKQKKGE